MFGTWYSNMKQSAILFGKDDTQIRRRNDVTVEMLPQVALQTYRSRLFQKER